LPRKKKGQIKSNLQEEFSTEEMLLEQEHSQVSGITPHLGRLIKGLISGSAAIV
jgi:hypothetical protein